MTDYSSLDLEPQDILRNLLARGGTSLVIAASAYAHGYRSDIPGQFTVLSPEIQAAALQILAVIEINPFAEVLESALQVALS